jgi:hypothetical protein
MDTHVMPYLRAKFRKYTSDHLSAIFIGIKSEENVRTAAMLLFYFTEEGYFN